jgi:geranylgeranylglycerol-phosphate geranylgeranyltransferase
MCTFIINDLDDAEKDKTNHPERPLPSHRVSPSFVATIYYTCLAAAMVTIRLCVTSSDVALLYYFGLVMAINYRYVVSYLPLLKSLYVACASTLPVWIVKAYYPADGRLTGVAVALLLFVLGREMCMDVRDRRGDAVTIMHDVNANNVVKAAFACQLAGLVVISLQLTNLVGFLLLFVMAALVIFAIYAWFLQRRRILATALMKVVMYIGLYFML